MFVTILGLVSCEDDSKDASKGLVYSLNVDGESYSIYGAGDCKDALIIIPKSYENKPVTGICDYAFAYPILYSSYDKILMARRIGKIQLPSTITEIGSYAFYDCSALESIVFDGTVEQWNEITKGDNWNGYVPATYVQCSDGTVPLN